MYSPRRCRVSHTTTNWNMPRTRNPKTVAPTSKKAARRQGRAEIAGTTAGRVVQALKDYRPLVSGALDAAAMLPVPGAAAARAGIRAVTGFNERRVNDGGVPRDHEGVLVQTMNAPVAFARNQRAPFFRISPRNNRGEIPFHVQAMVGTKSTTSGGAFEVSTPVILCPGVSTLFPANYQKAATYSKWRPTRAVLHYVHYAPTSTQAAIFLTYIPQEDPTVATSYANTSSNLMASEYAAMGSAYEDFSLEFVDKRWNPSTWFTVANTDNSSSDDPIGPGCVAWASEAATATASVGYIFIELQGFFIDERAYYAGAGLVNDLHYQLMGLSVEDKAKITDAALSTLRKDLIGEKGVELRLPQILKVNGLESLTRRRRTSTPGV